MRQGLKDFLRPLAVILHNCGFDPRRFGSLKNLPKYWCQRQAFKRLGGTVSHHYPVLTDYDAQAGSASGHYFHQDLLVASLIHTANPERHIDVGSRIDGFVAHVASFRSIEVIDIRELSDVSHPTISFLKADVMDAGSIQADLADSISCLHAIEHFGLGRYGDPIDPEGHIKGFNNLITMLKKSGTCYISFPIGETANTHFNAHRIFAPGDILTWSRADTKFKLLRFDYVDDEGKLHKEASVGDVPPLRFGCGIYCLQKC